MNQINNVSQPIMFFGVFTKCKVFTVYMDMLRDMLMASSMLMLMDMDISSSLSPLSSLSIIMRVAFTGIDIDMLMDIGMLMDIDMLIEVLIDNDIERASSNARSCGAILLWLRYRCLIRFRVMESRSLVTSSATPRARSCRRLAASAPLVTRAIKRKRVINFIIVAFSVTVGVSVGLVSCSEEKEARKI